MPKLCNINNISEKSIPNIMLALKMYDEQVIRQASITTMDNKFKGDYKAKLNLITDNYNQIANYFGHNQLACCVGENVERVAKRQQC